MQVHFICTINCILITIVQWHKCARLPVRFFFIDKFFHEYWHQTKLCRAQTPIRYVHGFWREFRENKNIGIFELLICIFPISTSWYLRFGTRCIVRNCEWRIFVNYYAFSGLFHLYLHVDFQEHILHTLSQKDAVPPMVISNNHGWKPNSAKIEWFCQRFCEISPSEIHIYSTCMSW